MVAVYKKKKEQPLAAQKAETSEGVSSVEVSSKSDVPTMLTTTVNSFVEKKILVGFDNVQKRF